MSSSDWPTYSIGEIAEIHNAKRVPLNSRERENRRGKYPYYGASGIVDYIDDYIFDGDFVLISEDGENLRSRTTPIAFRASGKFWVNNHAHIVRGKKDFVNDWLVYYFQNLDLNPFITGAVQPKLNKQNLELIEIPMPDDSRARKITSILSALDEKIELNRQTNATLEAIAQAIFKEWFVHYNYPGATGDLVDSELGLIPAGWHVGKLEDVAEITMGLSPPGDSYNDEGDGVPLINGPVEFGEYFALKSKWTTSPTRMAEKGDLIFCVRGSTTGRRVVADDSYCIGRGVCSMRARNGNRSYLYALINFSLDTLLTRTSGSVFPSLSRSDIFEFPVLKPQEKLISEFESIALPIVQQMELNIEQSVSLSEIRDTFLPRLMRGEIVV